MKLSIAILLIFSVLCGIADAADETCTTGNTTGSASGLLFTGGGYLRAIQLTPDTNDVILTLYDSKTAASGRVVGYWSTAGSASPLTSGRTYDDVLFKTGLYYSITQTGATFSVEYGTSTGRCGAGY